MENGGNVGFVWNSKNENNVLSSKISKWKVDVDHENKTSSQKSASTYKYFWKKPTSNRTGVGRNAKHLKKMNSTVKELHKFSK